MRRLTSRGFTLVELLVVITIIGMLVGMLLPAVNAGREAGRRAQCKNNIKQISLAFLNHESAQGFLPTGGWGWDWIGDPNRGFTNAQPAGWGFNILPDMGQDSLYQLQNGLSGSAQAAQAMILAASVLPSYNCPSRRRLTLFPNAAGNTFQPCGINPPLMFRTDYAANYGNGDYSSGSSPASYAAADAMTDAQWNSSYGTNYDGICYRRSQITMASITDGASCTYMVGEKYLDPDSYYNGKDTCDDQGAFIGHDRDILRGAESPPMQDTPGNSQQYCFGSAHSNGWNASFCDGSVRQMSYSIDLNTNMNLADRHDGNAVDMSKF